MKNLVKVGQTVICNGYEGIITKILDWNNSMVEVRVPGGITCVCVSELKEVGSDKFIGK